MTLVLTAVPAGLRGDLTKWLLEISPGVFVGKVSARIRDFLWGRVVAECATGKALLVHSAAGEQGLAFLSHNHEWVPTDFDGVLLMKRPSTPRTANGQRAPWSTARALQRSRTPSWAQERLEEGKVDESQGLHDQNT